MSDAVNRNNKRPGEEETPPTASFSDLVLGPGSQIGRFRIEQELGRGGMGAVYLAHDTKLDRLVAIKSLPAEVMGDLKARSRFAREARVLASLNHPNIATIYEELEETEGVVHLILEYVPGQALSERTAKGPLKLEEVLSITLQIAEAVAAAHEHDVIHRDLKPGNIKITPEGKVKVLDFGLAKAVGGEAVDQQSTITEPGRVIGTPGYMSPEQARGKPTDKRSDIWSFGCVLYEMLTGRVPFKGETISDTLANILQTDPDWQALPQATPASIRSLLRRCLEKEPRRRLRDMSDIAITLEDTTAELRRSDLQTEAVKVDRPKPTEGLKRALPWLITGAAVTIVVLFAFITVYKLTRPPERQAGQFVPGTGARGIKAIVVLPFENLSGDSGQEYFVDGMTDALSAELGKIRALRVISRTSAMRYKDIDKTVPEIAEELGVDAVIEGSVLKADNDVRVTAQLVDGRTDAHLWSENYTGTLTNILALQSEVTLAIAREIEAALTPEEERRITRTEPVDPEAHEAFLRGRWYFNKYSLEGFTKAREYFELAIEKDPNYAPPYAWLAMAYGGTGYWGYAPPSEIVPKAKEVALKAIKIDDTLADAHLALAGCSFYYDWDWPAAERQFKRAIELNPNLPEVRHSYSFYLATMGRLEEAIAESKRAEELDPLNLVGIAVVGGNLLVARRYDEAIKQFQKPLEMDPGFYPARQGLWGAYQSKNLYDQAFAEAKKAFSVLKNQRVVEAMERGWAESGYRGAMRLAAEELVAQSKQRYVRPIQIARLYADADDKDQALHWLQRAYEEREAGLVHLRDPGWDSLRSDPRFQKLLQQMNFPEAPVSEPAAKPPEAAQEPIEKIAVLPFTSISSEAGEEWFVDGMTDALITQLGKIKALTVISRTSAMQYKNISRPMREIAQELGVDGLVEGSVIRAGNDVQVTARLINGRTDERIWGDFFQGTFSNILALQGEVTLAVARQIEAALTPEEEQRIAATESINPDAYEAYLKGRWHLNKYTPEGLTKATEYFELALEKDPEYALAYVGLTWSYFGLAYWGYRPPREVNPKMTAAASKAMELDDTLAEVHGVTAIASCFADWDWPAAEREFKRAIELNPNCAEVLLPYSTYLTVMGHPDEGMAQIMRAHELDPLNFTKEMLIVWHLGAAHRYDEAIERLRKLLELDPDYFPAHYGLWRAYRHKNLYEEALQEAKKAYALLGNNKVVEAIERGYKESGYPGAMGLAAEQLAAQSKLRYVGPTDIARMYVDADQKDQALDWLHRAYEQRDPMLIHVPAQACWDSLRSDPRFKDLLRRMNLPP